MPNLVVGEIGRGGSKSKKGKGKGKPNSGPSGSDALKAVSAQSGHIGLSLCMSILSWHQCHRGDICFPIHRSISLLKICSGEGYAINL